MTCGRHAVETLPDGRYRVRIGPRYTLPLDPDELHTQLQALTAGREFYVMRTEAAWYRAQAAELDRAALY